MVNYAVLARCCNWRITSTSRLCNHWESDKICRFWIKESHANHFFFWVSLSTLMDGYCGLRDRPTTLLPPCTCGATRRACSHQKQKHNTRNYCSAATTTRRMPGNTQGTVNVGVTVHIHVVTHLSKFTYKWHLQVVAQCFYIYYYTQLLNFSDKNPSRFRGVTSLVDVNPIHGQTS